MATATRLPIDRWFPQKGDLLQAFSPEGKWENVISITSVRDVPYFISRSTDPTRRIVRSAPNLPTVVFGGFVVWWRVEVVHRTNRSSSVVGFASFDAAMDYLGQVDRKTYECSMNSSDVRID